MSIAAGMFSVTHSFPTPEDHRQPIRSTPFHISEFLWPGTLRTGYPFTHLATDTLTGLRRLLSREYTLSHKLRVGTFFPITLSTLFHELIPRDCAFWEAGGEFHVLDQRWDISWVVESLVWHEGFYILR